MYNKLVTVIMGMYNSERYLRESIESILQQTYDHLEFIIIDDCSNDRSLYIAHNYRKKDKRIKIFKNSENMGLAASLNKGIMVARGEYIARMDADDISLPTRIEKQIAFMNAHPSILLSGSECIEINEYGKEIFYKKMPSTNAEIYCWIYKRNPFIHPSVIFRSEFFEITGLYNENFRKFQDLELWARAMVHNIEMANISEPLLYFRVGKNTWNKRSSWRAIRNEMKVSFILLQKKRKYKKVFTVIFVKLLLRIVLRIMPDRVNKYLYTKLR